jgi:hypothetical protein
MMNKKIRLFTRRSAIAGGSAIAGLAAINSVARSEDTKPQTTFLIWNVKEAA